MSATPARAHTRRGVRHALASTGRVPWPCAISQQPDDACGCPACVAYFDALDRRTVPSTSLVRE